MYGPDARKPGTFAANCLLARRMAERGVRFVQLFHRGWDQHGGLPADPPAGEGRRPGLGRPHQGPQAARPAGGHAGRLGRRIRPHGLQPGHADQDQLRPRPPPPLLHDVDGRRRHQAGHQSTARPTTTATTSSDPVHVHDLNATILHCLGIDHKRLTYKFQGRDFRLTDVHGEVHIRRITSGELLA